MPLLDSLAISYWLDCFGHRLSDKPYFTTNGVAVINVCIGGGRGVSLVAAFVVARCLREPNGLRITCRRDTQNAKILTARNFVDFAHPVPTPKAVRW